jgi:hypothetical protein
MRRAGNGAPITKKEKGAPINVGGHGAEGKEPISVLP